MKGKPLAETLGGLEPRKGPEGWTFKQCADGSWLGCDERGAPACCGDTRAEAVDEAWEIERDLDR